jgi:hypothetical protein
MRSMFAIMAAALALVACAKASAAEPDSNNPAHCIAAMNFSSYWLAKGNKYPDKVVEVRARSLFEVQKIKSAGRSLATAHAESAALTKAYGNNLEAMNALFLDCGLAQDRDPRFKAQMPTLIALVRIGWREQASE